MTRTIRYLVLLLPVLLSAIGCRFMPLRPVRTPDSPAAQMGDEMAYYEYLLNKTRASTADGARITALLIGEFPWNNDLKEIRRLLLERNLIKEEWEISAAAPLTAGKLAFMMCYTADIQTSMIMWFTGPTERYALREAIFHELMNPSCTYCYVSGEELLNVVSRTEAFMRQRSKN